MMKKILTLITLFVLTLGITGCLQDTASLATLDEMTGITNELNNCAGRFKLPSSVSNASKDKDKIIVTSGDAEKAIFIDGSNSDSEMKKVVKQTLTSVPLDIQTIFFGMGGKIIVNDQMAKNICDPLVNTPAFKAYAYNGEKSNINTCWNVHKDNIAIFAEANDEKIRHSLLRSFSYVYSQVIFHAAEETAKFNTQLDKKYLNLLTNAFLSDLNHLTAAGTVNKNRANALLNIKDQNLKEYVFAEAFDSYYCNDSTKDNFKTHFPLSFRVFEKMTGNDDNSNKK